MTFEAESFILKEKPLRIKIVLPENDLDIWKWASGAFFAVLGWVGVHTWKASAKVTAMEADIEQLMDFRNKQMEQCSKLQAELVDKVTLQLKSVFESLLGRIVLEQTKDLAEINKNIALIAQSHDTLEEKVAEISERINRRHTSDSGMRRRHTDTIGE